MSQPIDLTILNKLFDKIFVLTVDHDFNEEHFKSVNGLSPTAKDRKNRISERLKGLEYELFYGINGAKFKHYDENGIEIPHPSKLSLGQLGCSLSHVKMYELIANGNWDKVLIIEDDCVFLPEVNNLETYMSQLPSDWGMLYLGWVGLSMYNISENIFKISRETFNILHCTHSIGLTKDFAKKMYEFNKDGNYTADGAFTAIVKENNEICYAITPNLSVQENIDCMSYEVDLTNNNK